MKNSLLMILRTASMLMVSLLFAPFTYAISPVQWAFSNYDLSDRPDSSIVELYSTIFVPPDQQHTTVLYNLVQELRALPVGKHYEYYRQTLEQRGYLVLANYNDDQHWDFALEKMQQNLSLTVTYNRATGKSTTLTASGPRIAVPIYHSVQK